MNELSKDAVSWLTVGDGARVGANAVLLIERLYEDLPGNVDMDHPLVIVLAVYTLALLMVSNFKYRSFKRLRWRRQWPLPLLAGGILSITVLVYGPALTLFLLFLGYALSGPVETLLRRKKPEETVIPAEQ
jgi:CDP-diacylglycerol--serine O-phosphatidyltransferase